ncbi:MAG: N-acetylmuramidase family protein [Saprospiraceae bacterium]|nr:N-acetylmuramidase family protein [Saprospiraceae bacterium]
MQTLRHKSSGPSVYRLEEILAQLGYAVKVNNYFGADTDTAVKDFQSKNRLVVDGIVGTKTWAKLIAQEQAITAHNDKLLSEQDLIDVANELNIELAVIKAVNEVESAGNGFLLNGWCKILFEGHVFWRRLKKKGINPKDFQNSETQSILYERWTKKHYLGGMKEHYRLQKAAALSMDAGMSDAAHESCSWGLFQIMGYHAVDLGYASVNHFVGEMNQNEREHLIAFKRFLVENNLVRYLKSKNWRSFTRGYNGPGQVDVYSRRLTRAYARYK